MESKVKSQIIISAIVNRADGTVEDHGIISNNIIENKMIEEGANNNG